MTTAQKTEFLFKRAMGVGDSYPAVPFFSEPKRSLVPTITSQIWGDSSLIPPTAPVLPPDGIDPSGTVQYKEKLTLSAMPGGVSFYSSLLVNAIPFNYDPAGSYNYTIYKSDGTTVIPFGDGNWIVDNSSGLLTFYGTLPSGMPPKITFYRYVGTLGVSGSGITTDAAGVTVISDGASGVNPVNKGESGSANLMYFRKAQGMTLLDGANPPGGISGVAPYGNVDNSANSNTFVIKVQTNGAVTMTAFSFPSNGTNQTYAATITAHGTSISGGTTGYVYMKEMKTALSWPADPIIMKIGLGTQEGGDIGVTINIAGYDVYVTGITGQLITWLFTVTYSQYRY